MDIPPDNVAIEKKRKWENQYISLVKTKPEYIIETSVISKEQVMQQLQSRTALYYDLFCELGSGSGEHLIELARQNPNALCIGIELRFKRTYRTAEKAEQQSIKNLLLLRMDARHLPDFLPQNSLQRLYVNFPDPWEKVRWRKHRLLNDNFLTTLINLLKLGGILSYKTDSQQYFEHTFASVQKNSQLETSRISRDLYNSEYLVGNIPTEFERLFQSKQIPVFFLEMTKIRHPAA